MARRDLADARCLVTGASSGLGRALAVHLAAAGARVVLTGRSADRLGETARLLVASGARPDSVLAVPADLTVAAERARLIDAVSDYSGGALDVAMNVAGVGAYGRFESHDETVLRRVMELNLFALVELCRDELPLLRQGRRPILVNMGSIVARRGLPGRSEYSASKFAVAGFTEAIRAEWARDGIDVLLMNPGFTSTSFEDNLVVDTAVYRSRHRRRMTPDEVARATLRAVLRGSHEATLTLPGRLLLLVNRLSPRFVDWGLSRWTHRLYENADAQARAEATSPSPDNPL